MSLTRPGVLPDPPQRTDESDDFAERADVWLVEWQLFSVALNTFISELELLSSVVENGEALGDAGILALLGNTPAADKVPYYTGTGSSALATLTSAARTLLAQTTQGAMRTTGLGMSANGSSLVSAADYAAMRALLDVATTGAVQPLDADLTAIAALTTTSFGRALLELADAAALQSAAGLTLAGSAPAYAVRAWVSFNGTGTVTINGSGNVSSITDNGAGDWTVNLSTALPDTNAAANYTVRKTSNNQVFSGSQVTSTSTIALFAWQYVGVNGAALDTEYNHVTVVR